MATWLGGWNPSKLSTVDNLAVSLFGWWAHEMGCSMVGLMIGGSVNCKAADIVEMTVHLQACLMAVQMVAANVGLTEKKKVGNLVALLVFLNGPFGR